jgi:hypothetical protein
LNSNTHIHPNQELYNVVAIIDSSVTPCFNELLLDALDAALSSLGDQTKEAIYSQLDKNYDLKKDIIPEHPEEFSEALTKIFGTSALLLEIKIISAIHVKAPKLRINPKKTEFSFASYLKAIKKISP